MLDYILSTLNTCTNFLPHTLASSKKFSKWKRLFWGLLKPKFLEVCLSLPTQSTQQVFSAFNIRPESNHLYHPQHGSHIVSHLIDRRPALASADASEQQPEALLKQNTLHDPLPLLALSQEEEKPHPSHGLKGAGGRDRHCISTFSRLLTLLATLTSWLLLEPPKNIPTSGPLHHRALHPACFFLICSHGLHPHFQFK